MWLGWAGLGWLSSKGCFTILVVLITNVYGVDAVIMFSVVELRIVKAAIGPSSLSQFFLFFATTPVGQFETNEGEALAHTVRSIAVDDFLAVD